MWQTLFVDMKSLLSWQYLMRDIHIIKSWNISMVTAQCETFWKIVFGGINESRAEMLGCILPHVAITLDLCL